MGNIKSRKENLSLYEKNPLYEEDELLKKQREDKRKAKLEKERLREEYLRKQSMKHGFVHTDKNDIFTSMIY